MSTLIYSTSWSGLPMVPHWELRTAIDEISDEILRAVEARFYYLALAVTLSLPNICAALSADPDNVHAGGDQYREWVKQNLPISSIGISEQEFYGLRCGVLHSGLLDHHKLKHFRVIQFTLPIPGVKVGILRAGQIGNTPGQLISLDLRDFCQKVITAAKVWVEAHKHEPNVAANLPAIIRYRPSGKFDGLNAAIPVIA